MLYVHVLRIKCEALSQGDILRSPREPIEVISQSLRAKPTALVGRGAEWHIGNVQALPDDGIAFALGRTGKVTTPQFDTVSHDFREEEGVRAPFTIGVFDQRHQACGILRRSGVSQSAREISNKLEILLNSAGISGDSNSVISVEPPKKKKLLDKAKGDLLGKES